MSAIFYLDEIAYCYLSEDGNAVRYQVQIGLRDAENVQLIWNKKPKAAKSQIAEKDSNIVGHEGPITDGQKVNAK